LLAGLHALPLDLQLALELRYWEDQSGPELAAILELPEGTVRSRLRRGLEALRDALAAHDAAASGQPSSPRSSLAPAVDEDLEAWALRLRQTMPLDDS
jgi:RNA polymerase sigma-70 factor (ECF subfamily)